jgi:signal recognition particle receptor subunit beta
MTNTAVLDDPTLSPPSPSSEVGIARVFKIVVTGGFGVGKTTLIRSACGEGVLSTEEPIGVLFAEAEGWTPQHLHERHKTTTTAGLDFARIEVAGRRLHVFGTSGRMSFWTVWARLCDDAAGAIVVVDPDRPANSFAAVDFFEAQQVPFVVAVNRFTTDTATDYRVLYEVLNLPGHVPLLQGDLRDSRWARDVFTSLGTLLPAATN